MMNKQGKSLALAGVFALTAFTIHSEALGQDGQGVESPDRNTTTFDLGAGLGYSSNPGLSDDADGSAFGRVSAYLQHVRRSARTTTRASAYAENDTYFQRYGSKPRVSLSAGVSHAATEKLRVYANVDGSADFGGQLLGRIYGVPVDYVGSDPSNPDAIPPLPSDILDPDLAWANRRSYRVGGVVGASASISAKDSINMSAGVGRSWVNGADAANSTSFYQNVGWNRTLSERSSIGAQIGFVESDYSGPNNSAFVISPTLTYQTAFSENWSANVYGGLSIVKRDSAVGKRTSTSPTFGASVCRKEAYSGVCFGGGRSVQTSNGVGALSSWNAHANYYRRLDVKTTLQLQADYRRYRSPTIGAVEGYRSNYYGATAGVSRNISDRFSVDGQLGYRKVKRPNESIKGDASAVVSLRYRLGDL